MEIVIHLVILGEAFTGTVIRYESFRERLYARKYSFPLSDPNYVRNSQTITLMSLRMNNSSLMKILYRHGVSILARKKVPQNLFPGRKLASGSDTVLSFFRFQRPCQFYVSFLFHNTSAMYPLVLHVSFILCGILL